MSGELRGAAPAAGRRRRRGAAEPNAGLPRPCAGGVARGPLASPRLAQGGVVPASAGAGDAAGGGCARVSGCGGKSA